MVQESPYAFKGINEISFPDSNGGTTTAICSPFGPNSYKNIFRSINTVKGLRVPTGQDCADFLHALYCGPETIREREELRQIRKIVDSNPFYLPYVNVITQRKYKGKQGIYVVHDKEGLGENQEISITKLDQALAHGEEVAKGVIIAENVSFASQSTYTGDQNFGKFSENGYVIATYTPKGTEKLREVFETLDRFPLIETSLTRPFASSFESELLEKTVSGFGFQSGKPEIYGSISSCFANSFSFAIKI